MDTQRYYTTLGAIYDYLIAKCKNTSRTMSFPDALSAMARDGLLLTHMPDTPPFHSGGTVDDLFQYIRGVPLGVDEILPDAITYMNDPIVEEATLIPEGKDSFFLLDMPYMVDILHYHNFFEITYVLRGTCKFLFEGESALLGEGDLCIVSPQSKHSLPMEPGNLVISLLIRQSAFDSAFGDLLIKQDLLSLFFRNSLYESKRANYLLLNCRNSPDVLWPLEELIHECCLNDDQSNSCASALLKTFLARAVRASNEAIHLHHYEGYSQKDFNLTLVLHYIQQNYRTVTLSGLAKTFHFSETYLSKMIHKKLGRSFTEVLQQLKMNHALELLMDTSMKISEISESVGYDSVDHFTRTFRKFYGTPPQLYRRNHLKPLSPKGEGWK